MPAHLLAVAAVVLLALPLLADEPLHNFADVTVWTANPDGGNAPQVSAEAEFTRAGGAMRLQYADREPHWGNLTGPCHVPPEARALRLWVYKRSSAPATALHVWLFQPTGDAWLQQVRLSEGGRTVSVGDAAVGWHEARLPVSGFSFEPRGRSVREMTAVNRMLIGCNYGDLDVTLADMTWEVGPAQKPLPLPRTADLKIETGERGSIGILDLGEGLPEGFRTGHPPAKLAEAARAGGFGVTLLKAGDLADPQVLTYQHFDAVILPYGPNFPKAARETFLAFLKSGGSFLSTDGYAFDQQIVLTEGGWSAIGGERTAQDMSAAPGQETAPPMNTRTGTPGDAMTFSPDQIPIFDPSFRLEHATRLQTPTVPGADASRNLTLDKPVAGFSACALIGLNSPVFPDVYRRWISVLDASSVNPPGATGPEALHLQGSALAICHNFAGPFKGSSWAFSGLTDGTDLFVGDAKRRALFVRVLTEVTEKVFVQDITTDLACYEKGEPVKLTMRVANFGRKPATRGVFFFAFPDVHGQQVPLGEGTMVTMPSGRVETLERTLPTARLPGDLYSLAGGLSRPPGGMEDWAWSGFCIRDPRVLAAGPKLAWEGNYMTVDGRATFMVGSNQTGMMFYSPHENPMIWDRDFASMAEHNFHILRILHFSPFSKGGYEGRSANDALDLAQRPEKLCRQLDAIVQLAQKHHVAIFLSLHDWMPVELTEEQLRVQADWDRFWAERYNDVPGVFFDIQNEPGVSTPDRPDTRKLWNEWLRQRYGSDAALRAAWLRHPPEAALPDVPLTGGGDDWDDVRSADRKRFEAELLNRWVKANVEGIRAGNPHALACVGYLPWMAPADKMLGVKHTDFSNMHYYGGPDGLPLEFKLIDRRFEGKGMSIGECGAEDAHNQRSAGSFGEPTQASIERFQEYLHYAAGLGGAFICNWCWKDFDEMVFPWGLMRLSSNIPKPWVHTWEQGSLLLSLAEPAYEPPQVFILAPDQHRIGPHFDELANALKRSVDLLLNQRVNFGMANEENLEELLSPSPEGPHPKERGPGGEARPSPRALIWPLPYCPTDATFDRVLGWVQAGGTLYLSGDVRFDATRQPTRLDRLQRLGLQENLAAPTSPFAVAGSAWSQAPLQATLGKGKVLFLPYPLELRGQGTDDAVYSRFLDLAGVQRIAVAPADGSVRALSIPTRDGGRLTMLARRSPGPALLKVSVPVPAAVSPSPDRPSGKERGPGGEALPPVLPPIVGLQLAERGFAFILSSREGRVLAAESQGEINIGGTLISQAAGHYAVCALDGLDLRTSRQVLILPHQVERVTLARPLQGDPWRCWVGAPAWLESLAESPGHEAPAAGELSFPPEARGQIAVLAPQAELDLARRRVADHYALRFRP